jgi:hypothetical protein
MDFKFRASLSSLMKLLGTAPCRFQAGAQRAYLGEGLDVSRPDSISVGRMGPVPSIFPVREPEVRDELLSSAGVSRVRDLGSSTTVGFGAGTASIFGSRAVVDCEFVRSVGPSAARAPAARISSSVSVAGAGFFSRDLCLWGVGVANSETGCSDGCGVCLASSVFFS